MWDRYGDPAPLGGAILAQHDRRSLAGALPLQAWRRQRLRARGAAGANVSGYQWIEERRRGAEWIVRGYAESRPDWMALGWRELDWGLAQQQSDGGFSSKDPFHSTSFFVEALARLPDRSGGRHA